jgi:energy-coupling factor transporter ATP-binding protein EcfA2
VRAPRPSPRISCSIPASTAGKAQVDQLNQAASTIVVITHDHAIAERSRTVEILDGHIAADTRPAGEEPS